MKKRILWLMTHTTMRRYEVPLLVDLGYEVYCPKIFQVGVGDGSASITYEYDQTLTIPVKVLEELNRVDFYETITIQTMEILNQYFDIAMFHYYPDQFRSLVKSFHGVLVFRAFGLLQEISYTSQILADLGLPLLCQTKKLGERFFFAQAYPHLKEIECRYFQQRAIDMPVGLPVKRTADWTGGEERFLFVLPGINFSHYSHGIYQEFKKNFHGLKYMIVGAQPIPVNNDPNVTGFLSEEEFSHAMNHCAAMFYHSTEKNQIHYHPFEAVQNGMPLVFMGGGMMDFLGGKELPGRCETMAEARRKLKALAKGDRRLTEKIIRSQGVLLDHFSNKNCREKWDHGMEKISQAADRTEKQEKVKRIGVILPQPYLGGVLDYTLRLVKCIIMGAGERGDAVSVVLGYPKDKVFEEKDHFKEIREMGAAVREFQWEEKSEEWIDGTCRLMNIPPLQEEECCILEDGINHFEDCDYLIFTADRILAPLFTTRPYIIVAHDYIQRYLPDMLKENYEHTLIQTARKAEAVFVTTPATRTDAIQYAGIRGNKVILTPLMFNLLPLPKEVPIKEEEPGRDFFLWSTNSAPHKNHKRALLALMDYYQKGGKLACVMTGVNTELFDLKNSEGKLGERLTPYVEEVRQIIEKSKELQANLYVEGNLPKENYAHILQKAKFVFHPGYADNGNGTAIDAACLGVPTICSGYPAMRYIDKYVGLKAHFFDPFDGNSILAALQDGEKNWASYKGAVPTRESLRKFTVDGTYREIYQILNKVMGE